MSAFKRGEWMAQFASSGADAADQAKVRDAIRAHPVKPKPAPLARSILPPILSVRSVKDLPQELTVREAARALRLKPDAVYARIREGSLYAQREGRAWRVPLWAVVQYQQNRKANVG